MQDFSYGHILSHFQQIYNESITADCGSECDMTSVKILIGNVTSTLVAT